jgi:predicted ATP-grasp superfamily ATP-dependent carboligase
VTGAEEHQGLAVIRGLGRAGIPVVACGVHRRSLGFYSRYARDHATYASPFQARERFIDDIVATVNRTEPALIIPASESTLVVLDSVRHLLPPFTMLAAPRPESLAGAIDKLATLTLGGALGVPVPRTAWGNSVDDIVDQAANFVYPLALKPRGNSLFATTSNRLGFKVRYARSQDDLRSKLESYGADVPAVLVQEYATGTGRCVSVVCREGMPLVMFPYSRDREYPLSGGVSVMRTSIPLDPRVAKWTASLLGAMKWEGVAMVEFKYNETLDQYTLMEVNGRFQASTALALDAGLNLPYLVAGVFLDRAPTLFMPYRIGVRERWLRGDLMALRDGLAFNRGASPTRAPAGQTPSRLRLLLRFLRDFRLGTRYDELKTDDLVPGLIESGVLGRLAGEWLFDVIKGPARRAVRAYQQRRGGPPESGKGGPHEKHYRRPAATGIVVG